MSEPESGVIRELIERLPDLKARRAHRHHLDFGGGNRGRPLDEHVADALIALVDRVRALEADRP